MANRVVVVATASQSVDISLFLLSVITKTFKMIFTSLRLGAQLKRQCAGEISKHVYLVMIMKVHA